MKRSLALFLAVAALCCLTACRAEPAYTGTYRLDTERGDQDIAELYTLFGSSLRDYGAQMQLSGDGAFSYYLGLTGGEGTYTVDGSTVTAAVTDYSEGNPATLTLYLITEGEETFLLYPYDNAVKTVNIWWKQYEQHCYSSADSV